VTTDGRLEAALLGAGLALTRDEVCALAGVPEPEARAWWVALGFAEVPPGERAFTALDAEAVRTVKELRDSGLVDEGTLLVMARAFGQSLSRLAEAQVQVLRGRADGMSSAAAEELVLGAAGALLPRLEHLLVHVWRRQLAAAAGRAFAAASGADLPHLAVGFVDLVGFTRTSREVDAAALEALLERFEAETAARVAARGGRVVKTLGDAVLFVVDAAVGAVDVALETVEAHAADESLPEVRAGVAAGPVLLRLGDVFGEPVNLASRLTDEARPGTLLVDRAVHDLLDQGSSAYSLQRLHRRPVRGYRALQPYRVRRAAPDAQEPPA
jgi:adenylate cyclase